VTKWPGQNLNMKANGFYEQSKTLRFCTLDSAEWPLSVEDEWKKTWKKIKILYLNKMMLPDHI